MSFGMLFSGVLWLLPVGLGLIIVVWGVFLSFLARRRNWTRAKRARQLHIGRALIPILPLSGIFGTVWGLMNALLFMRQKAGTEFDMAGVVQRFGVALNTTFWGVAFAVVALVIYEVQIAQLEGIEDEASQ